MRYNKKLKTGHKLFFDTETKGLRNSSVITKIKEFYLFGFKLQSKTTFLK